MGKLFILLTFILLTLVSAGGFFYLNEKIMVGAQQLADGQKQIKQGETALKAGKAKLAAGKHQLRHGEKKYNQVNAVPLLEIATIIPASRPFMTIAKTQIDEGGKQIAQGKKQIAAGEQKIKAGEAKLKAGKQQWEQGHLRLKTAKLLRVICGSASLFFMFLSIGFGIYWRRLC